VHLEPDCLDELCIEGPDGYICTKPCITSAARLRLPQRERLRARSVSVCVRNVTLCRPCTGDGECQTAVAVGDAFCLPAADGRGRLLRLLL
jgi:hypothetical protein